VRHETAVGRHYAALQPFEQRPPAEQGEEQQHAAEIVGILGVSKPRRDGEGDQRQRHEDAARHADYDHPLAIAHEE